MQTLKPVSHQLKCKTMPTKWFSQKDLFSDIYQILFVTLSFRSEENTSHRIALKYCKGWKRKKKTNKQKSKPNTVHYWDVFFLLVSCVVLKVDVDFFFLWCLLSLLWMQYFCSDVQDHEHQNCLWVAKFRFASCLHTGTRSSHISLPHLHSVRKLNIEVRREQ